MVRDELSAFGVSARGGRAELSATKQLGASALALSHAIRERTTRSVARPERESSMFCYPSRRQQPPERRRSSIRSGSERLRLPPWLEDFRVTSSVPLLPKTGSRSFVGRPAGHNPSRWKLARMAS